MIQFMTYIDALLHRFFTRVSESTAITTLQLACFRIFFGGALLVYFLPSWSWLKDIPPAFYNPRVISFAALTDAYPPFSVLVATDVLVILLLLCITLGIYTRISLLFMFVISAIFFSYSFTLGKIDHYTNLFLFAYIVLAFTNSGTKLALVKDKKVTTITQTRALSTMGIIIAFGYMTAGILKCARWIDFDLTTSGFLDWFYGSFFKDDHHYLLAEYVFRLPVFFYELADYTVAILEVSGFIFLWKGKKYWRIFLVLCATFHLLSLLTLNLGFTLNVLCLGIFLIAPVLSRLYLKRKQFYTTYSTYFCITLATIALLKIGFTLSDNPLYNYHDFGTFQALEHSIDAFLWTFTIASGMYLFRSNTTVA